MSEEFSTFVSFFPQICQNCILRLRRKLDIFSFLKFFSFSINFRFFVETYFTGSSKMHSLCPEKHFGKNIFFSENLFFYQFWTLRGNYSALSQTFSAGMWQLQSTCPLEQFVAKNFYGKGLKFFASWQPFFGSVGKTAFYVSVNINSGEFSFFCYCWTMRKRLSFVKASFNVSPGTFYWTFCFEKNVYFIIIFFFERNFPVFFKRFPAALSKLNSRSP